MKTYPRVLSIAGSDSGGGAGIQADIKAISACGAFAATAITAITAQNTVGVTAIHPVPEEVLGAQIDAVLSDIGADAVKIGMLHNCETIRLVYDKLQEFDVANIVLDPVMVATSGNKLLQDDAIFTLMDVLIPLARVITPNIPEAEILLDEKISDQDILPEMAKKLAEKFGVSVLLKAGHMTEEKIIDILYDIETGEVHHLESLRQQTKNTHGTGCTLSSALAAFLACGLDLVNAVQCAHQYIKEAIFAGAEYHIGSGHGPVKHFYQFWDE